MAFSGVVALLFIFIPPGRISHTLPEHLPITINCTMQGHRVTVDTPLYCDFKNESKSLVSIHECSYICLVKADSKNLIKDDVGLKWCHQFDNCQVDKIEIDGINGNQTLLSYFVREEKSFQNISLNFTLLQAQTKKDKQEIRMGQNFCPNLKQVLLL